MVAELTGRTHTQYTQAESAVDSAGISHRLVRLESTQGRILRILTQHKHTHMYNYNTCVYNRHGCTMDDTCLSCNAVKSRERVGERDTERARGRVATVTTPHVCYMF